MIGHRRFGELTKGKQRQFARIGVKLRTMRSGHFPFNKLVYLRGVSSNFVSNAALVLEFLF